MEDEENPWGKRTDSPALTLEPGIKGLDLNEVEATQGVWSTSTSSNPAIQTISQDPARLLIDEFDPYGGQATRPNNNHLAVPQAIASSNLEPSSSQSSSSTNASTPMLPSINFSSITNVFKRASQPSSRSNTPPVTDNPSSKTYSDKDEKASLAPAHSITTSNQIQTAQKSEETQFDFNAFMEQMRTKPADPIAKYLRSFLKEFSRRQWRINDQIRVINDFLDFIAEKMRDNEIWRNNSEKEFDNAVEAMEKLVMNRLYHLTFTPALDSSLIANNPTDDLERDAVLYQRIRLFSWLKEQHLDLPMASRPTSPHQTSRSSTPTTAGNRKSLPPNLTTAQDYLDFAQRELNKINQYKAPRDKLITILNCCKIIFGLIRHNNGNEAGADAFVPYLIFVVLKANPNHLISNIQYIQRFRNPEKLQGETGYYMSSLTGAITFIESMDHSSLSNISQDEFEHHVEQAIVDLETPDRVRSPANDLPQHRAPPASSELTAQAGDKDAAAFLADGLANTREFFVRSSDLASKHMSKPLNAIGKIFTELGQQQQQDSPLVPHGSMPTSPISYADEEEPGLPRKRRGYTPSRYSSTSSPPLSSQDSLDSVRSSHRRGFSQEDYATDNTPMDAIQARINQTQDNQQRANLETLHQMFPTIDAEIREVVLISRQNDLSAAVDALLEMSNE